METCKMSGKSQGIFKWMISGNPANAVYIQSTLIILTSIISNNR